MEDDVDTWLLFLILAPVLALVTTIPIHPRFMKFPTQWSHVGPTATKIASINRYNFYAPYGANKIIYPLATYIHWIFVSVALGLVPVWIFVKLGANIKATTALYWLCIASVLLALPSPCYLGPSWSQRKIGFDKEVNRRISNRRDILPASVHKRYD